MAGEIAGHGRGVTLEAIMTLPDKLRGRSSALIQRIEYGPQNGVGGGHLKDLALLDRTYIYVIGEIDSAGRARGDMAYLERCFGENQELGGFRNI